MRDLHDKSISAEIQSLLDGEAPVWVFDFVNHRMLSANDAALRFWHAKTAEEFLGRDYSSDSKAIRERLWQTVNALKPGQWACDSWTLFPGGKPTTVLIEAKLVAHKETDIAILFRLKRNMEYAQSDPEGLRMMLTARTTPVAVSMFGLDGHLISENPAALLLRKTHPGWTDAAMYLGTRFFSEGVAEKILQSVRIDENHSFEFHLPNAEEERVFAVTSRRILDPVTGDVVALITEEDITVQTRLTTSLATLNNELESRVEQRSQELLEMSERLRQSQKMEAIGKLTGGIAHDFNNLLAVVQGNAELLQINQKFEPGLVDEITAACKRGAELTHRLLAYARKQRLNAKPIDLADLSGAMEKILQRTLGADIKLSLRYPPDLWLTFADAGQVEDALLNLALNSRDAMPNGGELLIALANATLNGQTGRAGTEEIQGEFVSISVTDTGTGMSPEVLSKATDPFFTTKEVGEGTGLGLSMVFGFARQSNGNLNLASKEGAGTTVTLYLPRYVGDVEAKKTRPSLSVPYGRGERVALVEDDPAVLKLVERFLSTLNYRAVSFDTARKALDYLRSGENVDVLLTDVVLPEGLLGPDLANMARSEAPGLKVVLMSGYPADAQDKYDVTSTKAVFLHKPLTIGQLAEALRGALNTE